MKYAASLAKTGELALCGMYWDPSMDATSIKIDHGCVFPVRLHNSFLLEEPCVILGKVILQQEMCWNLRLDSGVANITLEIVSP